MTLEWIDEGGPRGGVWQDWLRRASPLLALRLGPHPGDWLKDTPPPNLAWLKAFPADRKQALAERIGAALRNDIGGELPVPMQAALQTLAQPNSALVITGQQPGLWGGPCFTLWKALSAVVAAKRLNDPARRPAWAAEANLQFVPAFWVAGEDADVGEAARAWTWTAAGGIKAWNFADAAEWRTVPQPALNDLRLGPVAAAFPDLLAALDHGESRAAVEALLAGYRDSTQTFCSAFVRLLSQVLGALGMLVIESRALAGDPVRDGWVARGIAEQAAVTAALQTGAAVLAGAQYEVGFPPTTMERGPFIFLADAATPAASPAGGAARRRLIGAQPPYGLHQQESAQLSAAQLEVLLKQAPQRFTFGAPLRVLVQNSVLPTAAVVLGPGELSYWAQLRELSDRMDSPWPALLPRISATALLPKQARVLRKLNLPLAPFLAVPFNLNQVVPPGGDIQPWVDRQKALLADLKAWFAQGGELVKSEQKLQEKTVQKLEYEIDKFAGRVTRAHAEAATGESSAIQGLRDFVHPHGPQERSLVWPVLLNARGVNLPAQWVEELQGWLDDGGKYLQHAVLQV